MSDALRDALVEAATKAFMRFAGRDPDAEIAVYDCDVPTRLPAWELQAKAMEAALDAAEALRANSSDVSVPREAWDLWRAECQKPQFFTQTSGGGKASVEFTYHGEGALKRAQAMHSALTAIALAAGSGADSHTLEAES
jgi:hypothetical protein